MEPCLFRHGKLITVEEMRRLLDASMEPCLFRHGKRPALRAEGQETTPASMEPCLFRHGKTRSAEYPPSKEVEPSLQWSHVFSDMVRASPGSSISRR